MSETAETIDETGTDIAAMEAQELASIEAEMAAQAAALSENLTVSSSNISNSGKQFTMPDGTVMGNKINVIILGYVRSHELYPDVAYNANKPEAPICYSRTLLKDPQIPHKNVAKPECDTCIECPNNEWGSKGQGKACKETYRVAVIVPDYDANIPVTLKIVSTGMKGFDTSIAAIQKTFGKDGKLAMPYAATVSAEFTDATFPVVKITGNNAKPNSSADIVKYYRMAEDAVKALL